MADFKDKDVFPVKPAIVTVEKLPVGAEKSPSIAAAQVEAAAVAANKPAVAPPTPAFAVMSDDIFKLRDTNNDGIPDIVEIIRPDKAAEAKRKADLAKFAAYHKAVADARLAAARANVGKSAIEVTAAENVAEAKVKADWKGPVPPVTDAEKDQDKVDAEAAAAKDAIKAEVAKLNEDA